MFRGAACFLGKVLEGKNRPSIFFFFLHYLPLLPKAENFSSTEEQSIDPNVSCHTQLCYHLEKCNINIIFLKTLQA